MKSLRLNKELRQTILTSFLSKYNLSNPEPEVGDETKARHLAAVKIQKKLYGKYEGLLPDEFIHKTQAVRVQLPNGSVQYWYFGRNEGGENISLLSTRESKVQYVFTEQDEIYSEYKKVADTIKAQEAVYDKWNAGYCKFKSEVQQVLESVNTTGQLVEVWPESLPFIPQEISDPSKINLPAVNFAEINKIIS